MNRELKKEYKIIQTRNDKNCLNSNYFLKNISKISSDINKIESLTFCSQMLKIIRDIYLIKTFTLLSIKHIIFYYIQKSLRCWTNKQTRNSEKKPSKISFLQLRYFPPEIRKEKQFFRSSALLHCSVEGRRQRENHSGKRGNRKGAQNQYWRTRYLFGVARAGGKRQIGRRDATRGECIARRV